MIVCRDCGHQNEDDDEWCGSCGAFLEFKGQAVQQQVTAPAEVAVDDGEERFKRVKQAMSVDEMSLAEQVDTDTRTAAADAALAAKVIADRETAAAEAAARRADEDAAERLAATKRQQEQAAAQAAQAAEEVERLRRDQEAHAEQARVAAEQAAAEAERKLADEIRQAEEQARAAAEAAAQQRARELAEQEQAAEAARVAAAAEAERARHAEAEAEQRRIEAQRRVEEAAAAAAAAAVRAAEERDAIAAAKAAGELAEAEATKARAEAAAATAAASEEIARMRAEAEAAKAEAAQLRATAQAEAARSERERAEERGAREAQEQADAARRRLEGEAAAQRRLREADEQAARLKSEAEAVAAQRTAEAELAAKEAEAKAAAARAEEEQARAAAEAAERERDRQRRLQEAAAMVHKPSSTSSAPGVAASSPSSPGSTTAKPGSATDAKKPRRGKGDVTERPPTPSEPVAAAGGIRERTPDQAVARKAPKSVQIAEINPGDLVCGSCGTGNVATRKFCRKCGTSLAEAKPAKLGFFARLRARRRLKRQKLAGSRPGRRGGGRGGALGAGASTAQMTGRVAWFRLNTTLLRIGALLGVLAMFGFGVEPIRKRLQLPNVRQKVIDTIRGAATPVYDPVRPVAAVTSSNAPDHEATKLIDLGNNTSWLAAPNDASGVGSRMTITFDKPFDLARVLLTAGQQGSTEPGEGFVNQPRPSEFRVIYNDDLANPVTVSVKDTEKPQVLNLKHDATTKVQFEITGIYPASDGKGRSVAVTEVEFFQRRKLGDDFETLAAPKFFVTSEQNASALSDDNLDTPWVSVADADGVGQGFSMVFDNPTDIDRIRIATGHAEQEFSITPRANDVQLAITCQGQCDPTKQIGLKDSPGFQTFSLKATGVTKIDLTVRSVHGAGGGVAFAEVQVQRKRPKVQ
jgi:hypothetical protein